MKTNNYTEQLKKELMEEYVRVCEEVRKGHMTADEAHSAVIEEADELFDTCLDQLAMLQESGKDFDEEPYNDFTAWITFKVLMRFDWQGLSKFMNSEREVA